MSGANLLPSNARRWERAVADACAVSATLQGQIPAIKLAKLVTRPPTILPFLAWEYGLAELRSYIANPHNLIDWGRAWTALRGGEPAIDFALGWLGVVVALHEDAPPEKRFWNAFQMTFEALPADEQLEAIEQLATLSVPLRSKFRRGIHGYRVDALEADHGRLDWSMLDWESGVKATLGTRDFPEAATWSFGRSHEIEHFYAEAEGTALGNWLEEPEGDTLVWTEMTYPWTEATVPWAASAEAQRRALLAGWFTSRTIYLALRDGGGQPIGWRRCRAVRAVAQAFEGGYVFDGVDYDPAPAGGRLYVEAMTQFDDADGVAAAEVALVVGAELTPGIPPGRLWLEPGQLSGGVEFATAEVAVPLRRTVREQFKFMVRF